MDRRGRPSPGAVLAGTGLLLVRGHLLWVTVPVGLLLWVASVLLAAGDLGPGQVIGWLDLNLVALLQRTLLKPFFEQPVAWVSWADIDDVTHRVRFLDPA